MSLAPLPQKPPRPGLGLLKRFALGCVAIFLLAAIGTATAGLLEIKTVADIVKTGHKIKGIENVLDDVDGGGPQTLLLVGSDRRWEDRKLKVPARSDTMMLVRLDPDQGATAVMSLPRDLAVTIPGHLGTQKLNAAYADGGAKLLVQTIKGLFGGSFPINHVVNVTFGAFSRAINYFDCFYVDIDRKYFHSNKGVPIGQRWSAIDVEAGYQRLCGMDSLAFVRFRHTDNDEVRAARQQWYLKQVKDQLPLTKLVTSRHELLKIFTRYTDTDISSTDAIFKLLKLSIDASSHPVRSIHLAERDSGSFVTISSGNLRDAKRRFLAAKAGGETQVAPTGARTTARSKSSAASGSPTTSSTAKSTTTKHGSSTASRTSTKKKRKKKPSSSAVKLVPGLIDARVAGENKVALAATTAGLPLYFPGAIYQMGGYTSDPPRVYAIKDTDGRSRRAYRITLQTGLTGQYYGIQGTTWQDPPLLAKPSETRTVDGRKLELFYDAKHLRIVAWHTPNAVYWVSNTLSEQLSNSQMLWIARSLRRIS